jgi:transcriptional regulator with XRE-family HTH domain
MALSTEVDGSKIKMLRKRKVLTQTELGTSEMKKRGLKPISLRTIQKIENDDKYQCSMKVVINLAKVLGVGAGELFCPDTSYQRFKSREEYLDLEKERNSEVREALFRNEEEEYEEEYVLDEENIRLHENLISIIENDCERLFANDHLIKELRKLKFDVITFDSLMKLVNESNSIKKDLDQSYNISEEFRKALCEAGKRDLNGAIWGLSYGLERIYANFQVFDRDTTLRFFEVLSKVHWYSIDCDIPDDEETLSLMSEVMDQAERCFESGMRKSDELRIKFNLLHTIRKLNDLRICVFYGVREYNSKEWNTDAHQWDYFKSYSIRILIKYQKNKNFILEGTYIDKYDSEFYPPEKLFDRIESRNFIEQYPEEEAKPKP